MVYFQIASGSVKAQIVLTSSTIVSGDYQAPAALCKFS